MTGLRAIEIYNDSGFRLIAIESVSLLQSKSGANYRSYGRLEPIAVIVCNSREVYALDMQAQLTGLDQLKREVPELASIIASISPLRD